MDYRATNPFPTPPVTGTMAALAAADATLHWDVLEEESGQSGIIVTGDYRTIKLQSITVSWNGIESAGEIIINMPDHPAIVILQNDAGSTSLDFHEMPLALGDFGIRVANNSVGGQYVVTAFYTVQG